MKFSAWVEEEEGRGAMLAAHFDVTPSAISQWKKNGVPKDNMLEVRRLSDGRVSLEEMLAKEDEPSVPAFDPIEDHRKVDVGVIDTGMGVEPGRRAGE
jgi:hypothetical protein